MQAAEQLILVYVVVIAAAAIAVYKVVRTFKRPRGCTGCSDCPYCRERKRTQANKLRRKDRQKSKNCLPSENEKQKS